MYNYIPHPSNCRQVSGIITLRIEEGAAGYGVYWMLLEILRDSTGYKISDNDKAIAFAINEHDIQLVHRVVHNYGLFDFDDDGLLFSPWLLEQMEAYDSRKKKLQEAGRRGAAKRFTAAAAADGQAIATPSMEDGQAIAPNITLPNTTLHNEMKPTQAGEMDWRGICRNQGERVDPALLESICKTQPAGHAPGYIAQVCIQYGMGTAVMEALCAITDNANVSHPTYKHLTTLVKRIQAEKYRPEYPANFFFSKLIDQ